MACRRDLLRMPGHDPCATPHQSIRWAAKCKLSNHQAANTVFPSWTTDRRNKSTHIYMTHTCLFALSQLPRAILGSYHRLACINHQYAGIRHPITPRKGDQPPNAVDATTDCITNSTMTDKQPPSPKNEPTSQTAKPNRFLSTAYHRAPMPPPPIDPRSACRANNAKPTWAGDGRFVCMEYIPQWILFGQSLFRHCKPRMLY